jgi:hypothetical protein
VLSGGGCEVAVWRLKTCAGLVQLWAWLLASTVVQLQHWCTVVHKRRPRLHGYQCGTTAFVLYAQRAAQLAAMFWCVGVMRRKQRLMLPASFQRVRLAAGTRRAKDRFGCKVVMAPCARVLLLLLWPYSQQSSSLQTGLLLHGQEAASLMFIVWCVALATHIRLTVCKIWTAGLYCALCAFLYARFTVLWEALCGVLGAPVCFQMALSSACQLTTLVRLNRHALCYTLGGIGRGDRVHVHVMNTASYSGSVWRVLVGCSNVVMPCNEVCGCSFKGGCSITGYNMASSLPA